MLLGRAWFQLPQVRAVGLGFSPCCELSYWECGRSHSALFFLGGALFLPVLEVICLDMNSWRLTVKGCCFSRKSIPILFFIFKILKWVKVPISAGKRKQCVCYHWGSTKTCWGAAWSRLGTGFRAGPEVHKILYPLLFLLSFILGDYWTECLSFHNEARVHWKYLQASVNKPQNKGRRAG